MANDMVSFVGRLFRDKEFRSEFVADPGKTLNDAGLDTGGLALPARIDEKQLMTKLEKVFSGSSWNDEVAAADIATLAPDALWERFGIIGSKAGRGNDTAPVVSSAVVTVVVIYGVSVVTGGQFEAAARNGVLSVNQLRTMRELGRVPRDKLTFSIQGPDGVAVHDLGADALAAFIDRTAKRPV